MHYSRLRLRGEIGDANPMRAELGSGSVNGDGYVIFGKQIHPLAGAQGKLLEHRQVLYDAIGPGPHPCKWCSKMLTWKGTPGLRINVDHLDFDRVNNVLLNLVVSCLDCNTKRQEVTRSSKGKVA